MEFCKLLPMLTDPARFGGDPAARGGVKMSQFGRFENVLDLGQGAGLPRSW
jgi:hypothetical protein